MPVLILGLLALVLGLWVLHVIGKGDPKIAARIKKAGGGLLAIGFAAYLGLRGEIYVALPLAVFGLGLLGWTSLDPAGFWPRPQNSLSRRSRMRSSMLEMELDHDTGRMRGRFTAGAQQGRDLDSIDVAALVQLLPSLDADSRALLLAYLDRRDATWRAHAKDDAAAGQGFAPGGKMTDKEAYQILGLQPGASAEDVTRSHRTLMKKLHPDQGGSTYLAARVNEAKDVLTRRHR